ncbi:hypothetical protein GCM10025778_16540 [Paeniglutamicibacter antarcticus]|uniref:Uncharacterized protein n=1 Tax=Paeniglutamicibacter antarcticus TaxID=494023 RepID=A0ABP9TKL3_9MICC
MSALDLYPTLLAAAGTQPEAYAHSDGMNLLPLLRGTDPGTHDALHWDNGFQWEVRAGKWKLSRGGCRFPAHPGIARRGKGGAGVGTAALRF